ncbi:hypothetical protein V1289_009252 [Bradyrhizobium sp. AZCC 2289]
MLCQAGAASWVNVGVPPPPPAATFPTPNSDIDPESAGDAASRIANSAA